MTTRTFFAFLALAFIVPAAQAEILIYAGTFQRTDANTGFKPASSKCYVITNPATGEFAVFNYGKIDGVKKRQGGSMIDGEYFTGAESGGPAFDLYNYVLYEDVAFGGVRTGFFLRGLRKTVQVSQMGGSPVTAERAKTLKGSLRQLVITLGGGYKEATFTAKLDTTRTVAANVAGRSFMQVVSETSADLDARGFLE